MSRPGAVREEEPRRPPGRMRLVAFSVLAALLALLAIELGFRVMMALRVGPDVLLYGLRPQRDRHTVALHDNVVHDYWKYFPHQARVDFDPVTGDVFSVRINNRGFRGQDVTTAKPGDVLRVITLGASSTFGYHARDDETYPVRLQEILTDACPEARFEVLNLGMPHLDSGQIASLFAHEALALEPDLVTFYEGINDCTLEWRRNDVRGQLRRFGWLRGGFRFARDHVLLVKLADEALRPRVESFDATAVHGHLDGRGARFVENVRRIRDACVERDIPFVVVSQASKSYLVPADEIRGVSWAEEERMVRDKLAAEGSVSRTELYFLAHVEIMRSLSAWAETDRVPFVDGVGTLDARRDVLVSWVHLSPEGNRLLAGAIAEAVLGILCPPSVAGSGRES